MKLLDFIRMDSNIVKCYLGGTEYTYNIGIRGGWADWCVLVISLDTLLHDKGPHVVSIDMPIQYQRQDMVVISKDIENNISIDYYQHHIAEEEKHWYKRIVPDIDIKNDIGIVQQAKRLVIDTISREEVSIYD